MGRPDRALRHAADTLAPDGTVMLVEPYARDRVEENFNPVGPSTTRARRCCAAPMRWRRTAASSSARRRRGTPGQPGAGERPRELPAGGRDALQPHPRGAPMTEPA